MATTKKLMRSNPNRYPRAGRRVEGTAGPDYPRVHRQHHPRLKQHGGILPWAAMPLTAGNDRKKAAALISQNRHQ